VQLEPAEPLDAELAGERRIHTIGVKPRATGIRTINDGPLIKRLLLLSDVGLVVGYAVGAEREG
jgi:hypothetical protein